MLLYSSLMERLIQRYACDFFKLRCKCLAFTGFGFRHVAHPRFVSRTAFDAASPTYVGNRSGGRKQLHTPLMSSLSCHKKVLH